MLYIGIDPVEYRHHYSIAVLDDEKKIQVLTTEKPQAIISYLAGVKDVITGINLSMKNEHFKPRFQPDHPGKAHFHQEDKKEITNNEDEPAEKYAGQLHDKVIEIENRLRDLGFSTITEQTNAKRFFLTRSGDIFLRLAKSELFPVETDASRWQRQLLLSEEDIPVPNVMEYFEEVTRFRILQGNLPREMIYRHNELNAIALAWLGWLIRFTPSRVSNVGDRFVEYIVNSTEQNIDNSN